ncbi:hypothetical protein EVAR_73480_1, partial [Eumeta japonica]
RPQRATVASVTKYLEEQDYLSYRKQISEP